MNLFSVIAGALGLLTGDKNSSGEHIYLGDVADDGYVESNGQYTNLGGALDNLGAKLTGSRLTRAEQQANAFTAQREDLAWQRQMEASNTAYQRQVADLQAAGLNPMMAVGSGNGAAVPSASSSGSVSPSGAALNLGSLLQLALDAKMLPAKLVNIEADTAKKNADAASTEQQTDFASKLFSLNEAGMNLSNDLKRGQIREIEQSINESKARENDAITHSVLNKANVDNLVFMQPFLAAELSARTDSEKAQAKAAIVGAAYQQGLIDAGVIEQSIKASNASIKVDDAIAEINRINALIAKGDKHALSRELGTLDKLDFWARDVLNAITKVVDSVPINFVVK